MPDPKGFHDMDQAIAAFRTMAAGLAVAYFELTNSGVPPEYATQIVVQMCVNLRPSGSAEP